MTDWKALAVARGLDIPAGAVDGIASSLEALELAFGPLKEKLPFTTEPSVTLSENTVLGR